MAEINLSEIANAVSSSVGPLLSEQVMPLILVNLKAVFKNEAAVEIRNKFIGAYDKLMLQEASQYPSKIKGKDPSALEFFRGLFIAQLDREIANIRVESNNLIIEIGDKFSWGYGRERPLQGEPTTPDILSYYIEGVSGTVGFISTKHYELRRDAPSEGLGRFGGGFLISESRYAIEGWERITKIKFSEIKHPISGQRPYREFEKVPGSIDFNKYIQLAVERAFKDFETING